MTFTYDVKKRKGNRRAYRILATIFIVFWIMQLIVVVRGYTEHAMLATFFSTAIGLYGLYLLKNSFRKTAYDITYFFDDNGMKVTHKYGVSEYTYDDIEFITMVVADPNMIFCVLNIKAKKDIYAIPFTMKKDYCEKIYEFVNGHLKEKESSEDKTNEGK